MKRLWGLCLVAILIVGLSACINDTDKNGDSMFGISIVNNSDQEIYGLSFEYSLGENVIGSGMVSSADGKTVAIGDSLTWNDFSGVSDSSEFSVECFVQLTSDVKISCGEAVQLIKEQGKTHAFSLTGNSDIGFSLASTEE